MSEINVSGNIFAEKDAITQEGERYIIRNKIGQGWGLPVQDLEPDDLRVLASRIEAARNKT